MALETHPGKIIFATAETYTNEYIDALQKNRIKIFHKKYRTTDLVLFDDIQFMEGKVRLQQEFLDTINALYEEDKQIVITADNPPNELDNFDDRLVSRLQQGLVVEIDKPDLKTRTAILHKKAARMNYQIDNVLMNLMAERITSNIRCLEGALICLGSWEKFTGQKIDEQKAEELIRHYYDKDTRDSDSIESHENSGGTDKKHAESQET